MGRAGTEGRAEIGGNAEGASSPPGGTIMLILSLKNESGLATWQRRQETAGEDARSEAQRSRYLLCPHDLSGGRREL